MNWLSKKIFLSVSQCPRLRLCNTLHPTPWFLIGMFMNPVLRFLSVVSLSLLFAGAVLAQDKVVYHIDNTEAQATKGLRNIRNHLDVDPTARITVVTHADGVDFLMEGAKDANGGPFAGPVAALVARGATVSIHLWVAGLDGLRAELFPRARSAYECWRRGDGDASCPATAPR